MNKKVLAKVGGKEITQEDVFKFLREVGPQVAANFQSPEGMEKVVEELVSQELLYLDAVENKLNEDEEYNRILEETKAMLLKNYAISKLISDVTVSEPELKKYYNENKNQFVKPESLRASHILVDTMEEAEKVMEEINNGLTFEEAAGKYSTCPSKENGGDLGQFSRGQMVPEFEEEAFKMEEDSISEPVKTQFGYHIINLKEKDAGGLNSFDEVKNQIHENLLRLKQQEKYLNKIDQLKNEYKVEYVNN